MGLLNAIILAAAIVAAGFFIGGRYDSVPVEDRSVVIVDRLTGAGRICDVANCYALHKTLEEEISN